MPNVDPVLWIISILVLWVVASIVKGHIQTHYNAKALRAAWAGDDFYHSLLIGVSTSDPMKIGKRSVYTDGKYSLVVARFGKPVAVLGFSLTRTSLRVYQMQGLRRVNLVGVDLGPWLLGLAVLTARRLRKHAVWVQAAERHIYYERPSLMKKQGYEKHRMHQLRMIAFYNQVPLRFGFVPDMQQNYLRGHYLVLRKKITWIRALRFHAHMLNRALREHNRLLQEWGMP